MTAAVGLTEEHDDHDSAETEARGLRLQGTVIGNTYRVGRCIGSGASSHVFEAEHLRLGRNFAIKVLRAELDGKRAAQRFRREAAAIARLRSEHIVSVIDCGEHDDRTPYLVMELLEGEDLRRLLSRSAPLPTRRAVHLAIEACRGLHEVHRAGLVHRDLKPENLYIARRSNGQDWCKILDFGVAKMEASIGTAHGAIVGTVRYMAPEQLLDSSVTGPATDIHALGAILFECLTGRALVGGATVQEAMFRIINRSPRELMGETELPERLAEIITSCLEKAPEKRPASALELAEALGDATSLPIALSDATLVEDSDASATPAQKRSDWAPARLAAGAFATTVLGALCGWHFSQRGPAANAAQLTSSTAVVSSVVSAAPRSVPEPLAKPASVPAPASTAAVAEAVVKRQSSPAKRTAPANSAAPAPLASATRPVSAATEGATLERFDRNNPYGD